MARETITLECTESKERNYTTTKNKKKQQGRLELKKYCPKLRKHTIHREVK
jgi:large subunit ribosomal protein L33